MAIDFFIICYLAYNRFQDIYIGIIKYLIG